MGAPADLEEARAVVEEQPDRLAGPQAERAQVLRDLVRVVVELPIGHGLARARHDVGGLVGCSPGVD